jgi:tRNA-dihydrouridine synthase 1
MLTRSYLTPESNKSLVAYTPMLHARLFSETEKFRHNHFQPVRGGLPTKPTFPHGASDLYLDGNPSFDRPLFVQFCANKPEDLLEAAEYVAPFCDAVDLNLGCPQGIAKKGGYGAFLQEDQELIYRLVNKLHTQLDVPVTAKIRVLETRERTLEYARMVLRAGASILTVHGRVREAKGHKTGLADWSVIRYLRENLPKETVIFANGNILCREDIDRCLEATGADAVMSAEGNLYDPAIFAEAPRVGEEGSVYWRGRDGKGGFRMDDAFRRYMDILYKYVLERPPPVRKPLYVPGQAAAEAAEEESEEPPRKRARIREQGSEESKTEKAVVEAQPAQSTNGETQTKQKEKNKKKTERVSNPNLVGMQAHCFHFLRALVSKHHNVRDTLGRTRTGDIEAFENVLSMVEQAVEEGIRSYEATGGASYHDEVQEANVLSSAGYEGLNKEGKEIAGALEEPSQDYQTSVQAVRERRRPWWVCQPHVRPLPMEAVMKGSLTLSKKELAKLSEEERGRAAGMGARKGEQVAEQGSKREQKRARKGEAGRPSVGKQEEEGVGKGEGKENEGVLEPGKVVWKPMGL